MSQFRFEIDHLGSSGGMELFHPGKGFEITFHINFGSFYENPVQDAATSIVQPRKTVQIGQSIGKRGTF